MKKDKLIFRPFLFIAIMLILLIQGCGEPELNSMYRAQEIKIDARETDWIGSSQLYDKDNGVKIGVINDKKDLYICITVWNSELKRKLLGTGLTIWLDREGDNEKRVGIHYPLGLTNNVMREILNPGNASFRNMADREEAIKKLLNEANEVEFISRGEERERIFLVWEIKKETGVELSMDAVGRALIYELKVPFESVGVLNYSITPEDGEVLAVGFETGKMERMIGEKHPGGGRRGRSPGGGMVGSSSSERRGGMGKGSPSGRMGDGRSSNEPFKTWVRIILASGPDARDNEVSGE